MVSTAIAEVQSDFALFLEQNLNKELLRFTTAGSVDDGKSTLIGRLLHDSKTVYEDQLASLKKSRINRSSGPIDFSLITDGLRAEREQGITIDVGYRYFATARRKFIIADTPGHEQYTRNMATGASTADLAVILIDGTKGLLPQTLRHTYISSLLGISSVVAAINKMDLLEYREDKFLHLEKEFRALAGKLGIREVQCIRPDAHFRGFAGQVAGGLIRPGDVVTALPSGQQSRVESIVTYGGPLAEAFSPQSVTLKLEDEIDLSRGDMLVSPENPPRVSQRFRATVVWMGRLEMNDIAVVELETNSPLFFDSYQENRTTGSFIVIDLLTNATLGAAMIQGDLSENADILTGQEGLTHNALIAPLERYRRHGHFPALFLVNLRAALSRQLERALFDEGFEVMLVEENPSDLATKPTWADLHAAGFVVIYHNPSLDPEGRSRLKAAAGDQFFDLSELKLPAGDAEAVEHLLNLAVSLRISPESGNPRKVV